MSFPPRLELLNICKRYGPKWACHNVRMSFWPGDIHAIVGDHGAGKSTLSRILSGIEPPDDGVLLWEGVPVHLGSPLGARGLGIAAVSTEKTVYDSLTVWENVLLALPQHEKARPLKANLVRQLAESLGLQDSLHQLVRQLPVTMHRRVEIFRALLCQPKILVLDEVMWNQDSVTRERVFTVLSQFAIQGGSVVFITQQLNQIRDLCTKCSIFRQGRVVIECDPRKESDRHLSLMMVGEELPALQQEIYAPGPIALQVSDLCTSGTPALRHIDFELYEGEIVGIMGIEGNGQENLLSCLAGVSTLPTRGKVSLYGKKISRVSATARRRTGLGFMPSFPSATSYVESWNLLQNMRMNSIYQSLRTYWTGSLLEKIIFKIVGQYAIHVLNVKDALAYLSAGDIQKFVLGRELQSKRSVLLMNDPTLGLDARSRVDIHQILFSARQSGTTILLVSADKEEVFALSDRVMVMRAGRLSPPLLNQPEARGLIEQWMNKGWREATHP